MDLPVYKFVFDPNNPLQGLNAMSIVNEPAIEELFEKFSSVKENFSVTNKDKQIISGAALIANKKIYRNNEYGEYYIYFTEENVEQMSQHFLLQGNQNNVTLEHEYAVNDVKLIYSWLAKETDGPLKWMVSYKITNDELWNQIKDEEFNGFSVEVRSGMERDDSLSTDYMNKEIKELSDDEAELLYKQLDELIQSKK